MRPGLRRRCARRCRTCSLIWLGYPPEWRESGSFLAYEEKLRALDHELALGHIAELASSLTVAGSRRGSLEVSQFIDAQARVLAILNDRQRRYADLAAAHAKESRWLTYAAFLTSSATFASALAPLSGLVIPAAVAAVGVAAAMAFSRLSDRSREEAKLADYLMALRNEVVHFRDVSELDAFPTSARVEELIARVLASEEAYRWR